MGRLFWKFFLASWLALLMAGVGVGTAVWWRHRAFEHTREAEMLITDQHAGILVGAGAEVLQYGGVVALRQFLQHTRAKPLPLLYAVDDDGQDILARKPAPELLDLARALYAKQTSPQAIRMVKVADGHHYLLFALLPENAAAGGELGSMPPSPHWQGPPPKPPSLWLPTVSGTVASLLLSAALAWYFAKPIRLLRNAFAAIAEGKLNTRVSQAMNKRHDELADLGRDFDHMAKQLEGLITAQQRLLHDVSHELRSPLARVQAAIGLAQQQPDKLPGTLERIERESQRISDLVGELLVLSRLEAGVSEGEVADTDLGGLLADIIEDARFEAEQKRVDIRYNGFEDVIVKTRSELLHRAVENVLRNAVQHCKPGGEVCVTAAFDETTRRLRIGIDDQGAGVDEAELQAIFQPFFRSRNRKMPDSSVGLGLTIAYRALEALNGSIAARNRAEGGLHVGIVLAFRQS